MIVKMQLHDRITRELQKDPLLLPALLLIVVLLAGWSDGKAGTALSVAAATGPANTTIDIRQFKYFPAVVTVHPGDKVRWTNSDTVPHTATAEDKSFDSGSIAAGESWILTVPAKKGNYLYLCTFHPNMRAKLIVQ